MHRSLGLIAVFAMTLGLTIGVTAKQKDDPKPNDDTEKPPEGWKEYSPRDKTFSVWIPEKTKAAPVEKAETHTVDKEKVKSNLMYCETKNTLYWVQETILPASVPVKARETIANSYRDITIKAVGGKVTEQTDIKVGSSSGKDYHIDSGNSVARVRVLVSGTRMIAFKVSGKKEEVNGEEGRIFIESAKFTTKSGTTASAPGAKPKILGTPFGDPEFKELAPEGGLLIGFEIGLAKSGKSELIKAVKPIFLVDGKEVTGEQHGTKFANSVTLKAKEGYAVGAISAKAGGNFDGMSVTFMKIGDGKLDSKDSYDSKYVGIDDKKTPVKLGGDGTPIVGIVGKTNDKDMTAMGLLFKGQENYEPKKK